MDNSSYSDCQEIGNITILNCTYADRHHAQKLGAKWNNKWRAWYIDETMDKAPFKNGCQKETTKLWHFHRTVILVDSYGEVFEGEFSHANYTDR